MGISVDLRLFEMSMVISCEYSKHGHYRLAFGMSNHIISASLLTKSILIVLCLQFWHCILSILFLCLEELGTFFNKICIWVDSVLSSIFPNLLLQWWSRVKSMLGQRLNFPRKKLFGNQDKTGEKRLEQSVSSSSFFFPV